MAAWSHRRGLKALSVVCLASALGVTTAVFSVVDGVLYRPLPFPDADRLAAIDFRRVSGVLPPLAYEPGLRDDRERLRSAIANSGLVDSFTEVRPAGLLSAEAARARFNVVNVDSNFFAVLGLEAFRGVLQAEPLARAVQGSATPTVVLGHRFWQRLGRPALGPLSLEGRAVTIAGVLAPGAKFPGETDLWVVQLPAPERPPTLVRLRPGVAVTELAARVEALDVRPLRAAVRPANTEGLVVLFLASGLVVLISWIQLAGLTVADILARMKEFGVRISLGATPRRLLAGSAMEQGATALAVGALALAIASASIRVITLALPVELTQGQYVSLDGRSVTFLGGGVCFGFALLAISPIWILRIAPLSLMRGTGYGAAVRVSQLRRLLVVIQVAVGAALLYVTGLLAHSLTNAVYYDYGFASDDVVLFEPPLPPGETADFERRYREKGRLVRATVERLQARADVVAAAELYRLPLTRPGNHSDWEALKSFGGLSVPPGAEVHTSTVGRDFARALGVELLQGEAFHAPGNLARQDVALVNRTFVQMFAGGVEIDGQMMLPTVVGRTLETTWFRGIVAGVVQDLVVTKVADPRVPQVFVLASPKGAAPFIAIRTVQGLDAIDVLQPQLEALWGPLPESRFRLLRSLWDESLVPYRGQAQLVAFLAAFAIPLAGIGVAGFMLFVVRSENRVIAIRLAIGAEPRQIRGEVMRRSLVTVIAGVGVGTATGIALGQLIGARLFGVSALDPASLGVTVTLFVALGLLASVAPARAASRTQPSLLLRE